MEAKKDNQNMVFDYRALRLLVGIIAFALPVVIFLFSSTPLDSISGSYYSNLRDFFTGSLILIGAFLFAYKGHFPREDVASTVAGVMSVGVALFPTKCKVECPNVSSYYSVVVPNLVSPECASYFHFGCAAVLFSLLGYFCLGPFVNAAKDKPGEKKENRIRIYKVCGYSIFALMFLMGIEALWDKVGVIWGGYEFFYFLEMFALFAFGVSWFVAGKLAILTPLVDEKEKGLTLTPRK